MEPTPDQLCPFPLGPSPTPTRPCTDLVNGGSLCSLGQSSANNDLTSGGLTHVGLEDVAKVQVLDLLGGDSTLSEHALDGGDSQLDGRGFGEAALEVWYKSELWLGGKG